MCLEMVGNWLIDFAKKENYPTLFFLFGEYTANENFQSTGSVYGIWIEVEDAKKEDLFNELSLIYQIDINDQAKKIQGNWYPLYWGKDISPSKRTKDHFDCSDTTSSLKLLKSDLLSEYRFVYGIILVHKYEEFEKLLHKKISPIIGSDFRGRKVEKVSVIY